MYLRWDSSSRTLEGEPQCLVCACVCVLQSLMIFGGVHCCELSGQCSVRQVMCTKFSDSFGKIAVYLFVLSSVHASVLAEGMFINVFHISCMASWLAYCEPSGYIIENETLASPKQLLHHHHHHHHHDHHNYQHYHHH